MEEFDVLIIGSGPAGYVCAIRAAQLGLKVCCVEKSKLGGTCLNIGCIPSKSLLHASQTYDQTKNYETMGISFSGVSFDLKKIMQANKITHKKGFAKIINNNEVEISNNTNSEVIKSKNIIIATGSEPSIPSEVLVDEKNILTSTGALNLDKVPSHLIIIGAGYIGLEMGSVWSRLGSKVTVIEYEDHILPNMDMEVAKNFQKILIKQGFDFKLSTSFNKVIKKDDKISVLIENKGQTLEIDCDKILISMGRRPYTYGLNLENIGVVMDKNGFIQTNKNFQTSVNNIYSIGDCKEGPMLAHKASEEGVAVAELLSGQAGQVNYDTIPSVIYTFPEVASVGKTEEELNDLSVKYKVGKFPFTANAKATVMQETEGFVKILSDSQTDEVLGVHIIGADAGNLIAELVVAMEFGASAEDLARTCHAHPTLTESIKEAALNVDKSSIHI